MTERFRSLWGQAAARNQNITMLEKEAGLVHELLSLRKQTKSYLEIGGYCGGSLWIYGQAFVPATRLCSVNDNNEGETCDASELEYTAGRLVNRGYPTQIFHADSQEESTANAVWNLWAQDQDVDVILVNADHTLDGTVRNLELYVPMLGRSGTLLLHNILGQEGSGLAWDHLKVHRKHYGLASAFFETIEIDDRYGMGVVTKDPGPGHRV